MTIFHIVKLIKLANRLTSVGSLEWLRSLKVTPILKHVFRKGTPTLMPVLTKGITHKHIFYCLCVQLANRWAMIPNET
jgi:hypothetical protein